MASPEALIRQSTQQNTAPKHNLLLPRTYENGDANGHERESLVLTDGSPATNGSPQLFLHTGEQVVFHAPPQLRVPYDASALALDVEMLTPEEREKAANKEIRKVYREFHKKAMETRNWSPYTISQEAIEEMIDFKDRVSPDSKDLILGFLGIEEFVGDYVEDGLNGGLKDIPVRRIAHLQWGSEEARHGEALREGAVYLGIGNEDEIDEYIEGLTKGHWSHTMHKGLEGHIAGVVYPTFQEKVTYVNYVGLDKRIRNEYGLPEKPTKAELARGFYFGFSEDLRLIMGDENAHHGLYLQITKIYLKYFREQTMAAIKNVIQGFRMPALSLLSNRGPFIHAATRTKIYTPTIYKEQIVNPILKALGLTREEVMAAA